MKYGCGFDYSDLYQSGMLCLVKATKNYNGRALFSTWASWCIISEIRHFVRSERDFILSPTEVIADKETVRPEPEYIMLPFVRMRPQKT
jgi:RNA polymerase sigma factor (sigma-70 family)